MIPGANRGAVDRLDGEPSVQPVATQALREDDASDGAVDDNEFLEENGEPPRNRTENPQIKSPTNNSK
jgi:hypothetical protein